MKKSRPTTQAPWRNSWIDPAIGFQPFEGRLLAFSANLPEGYRKTFPAILGALYALFMDYGAQLVEINPLVLTKDGRVIASDAKVELDDNGLYKHPELADWKNDVPKDEDQAAALAIGLGMSNYAKLDGDIGVIANGAGLGMGTMDAIRTAGGSAANFLDIGGGAQAELVKKSYQLVTGDPKVKALFINIFGGITRGDQVAKGIVEALSGSDIRKVPLVIRLTGTNEKEGREILAAAGMNSGGNDGRRRETRGRACCWVALGSSVSRLSRCGRLGMPGAGGAARDRWRFPIHGESPLRRSSLSRLRRFAPSRSSRDRTPGPRHAKRPGAKGEIEGPRLWGGSGAEYRSSVTRLYKKREYCCGYLVG